MNDEGQQNAYDDIYGNSKGGDKSGAQKAADAGKKAADTGKKAADFAKKAKNLKIFATPVGWYIIIAILVIFLIIGAVSFLQTMPGLLLGKIKDLASSAWDWIVSEITAKDVEQSISEEQLVNIAQYVQDMGYDLYTTGFGKPIYDENDSTKIIGMDDNYPSPLFQYAFADVRTYTKEKEPNAILTIATGGLNILTRLAFGGSTHGQGMLVMHDGLISNSEIDYDTKSLIMTRYQGGLSFTWNEYTYSLDGWAGRYGMPLSFSLALHLSTMKPDLVTTMIEEFETKVNIHQQETQLGVIITYRLNGTDYSIYESYETLAEQSEDFKNTMSEDRWEEIQDEVEYNTVETPKIYQPYITTVDNHWYYDYIIFEGDISNKIKDKVNEDINNGNLSEEITEGISGNNYSAYETVSEQETGGSYKFSKSDEIMGDTEGEIWITEEFPADIPRRIQVRQPLVSSGANERIKEIFADEYYTYDGTEATADSIKEGTAKKKPVEFNKKDALEAFSILENAKDLDSQYVYRDLKKLLIELEYFTEEDFETPDTLVLKWILSGYRPQKWPQREDEYSHGAILYSKSTEGKEEVGFEAEKSVTSPGNGIISKISEDSITIKFTEPEVVLDFSMKISGFAVNQDLKEGDSIEEGAEIGKTTDSDIKMILKDAKGSILDNIEDYISPKKVTFDSDNALFYWTVYESYGFDLAGHGPESAAIAEWNPDEMAVGIAQWTTIKGSVNNVREFCKWAYQTDPNLCAELAQFQNIGSYEAFSNINNIKAAFTSICARDREGFLQLQMAKKIEEYTNTANVYHASWLLEDDRSAILKGSVMAMWNYGCGIWTDRIKESNSDLENTKIALGHAASVSSTAGSLHRRWESQFALARDALEGVVSEEDLENWVRNGAATMPQYANDHPNPGVLDGYIY